MPEGAGGISHAGFVCVQHELPSGVFFHRATFTARLQLVHMIEFTKPPSRCYGLRVSFTVSSLAKGRTMISGSALKCCETSKGTVMVGNYRVVGCFS